jgi:uncharacterized protein (DUF1800 family)
MNRRALFTSLVDGMRRDNSPDAPPVILEAGAEPYTTPLTYEDALHLLRRTGFGPSHVQAKAMVGRMAADVVEELLGLDNEPDPPSPGAWIDTWTEDPDGADLATRNQIERQWINSMSAFGKWWIGRMVADETCVEKTTLFWSSHWVSEFDFDNTNSVPQMLYRQYLTLRKHRLDDLRQLALEITLDSAMLFYLGGTFNTVGKPNENYARELMELFLTGIGWYTEGDVKEAARVLTGWRTQRYSDAPAPNGKYVSWFDAGAHDIGAKQFLGVTIPARTEDTNTAFQVREEEVLRIIEILHTARAEAVSRFIATKVYKYFVYSSAGDVDEKFISDVAQKFRDADFRLRDLFKVVFSSAHFFDPALRGAQIKTPIEFVAGLNRLFGATTGNPQDWVDKMDQPVMDPPNVSGWPGYRSWISTNTYPVRRRYASDLIKTLTDAQAVAFIKLFDDYTDVRKLVKNVSVLIFPVAISQTRLDYYMGSLLQGAPDYDWPAILQNPTSAGSKIRNMLTTMSKAPDFQLC